MGDVLSDVEWLRNLARDHADGVPGMEPEDHHAWQIATKLKRLEHEAEIRMHNDPAADVHEATAALTAELTTARSNLTELINKIRRIEQELVGLAVILDVAQARVKQGEDRLRAAEAALKEKKPPG